MSGIAPIPDEPLHCSKPPFLAITEVAAPQKSSGLSAFLTKPTLN